MCARCGVELGPEEGKRYQRKFTWAPTWSYLTALVSLLIFFIAYGVTRKQLDMSYFLCDSCAKRSRKLAWTQAGFWASAGISLGVALMTGSTVAVMLMTMSTVVGLGLSIASSSSMRVTKHKDGAFTVTGAHRRLVARVANMRLMAERHEQHRRRELQAPPLALPPGPEEARHEPAPRAEPRRQPEQRPPRVRPSATPAGTDGSV